jgi:hypothetical protein
MVVEAEAPTVRLSQASVVPVDGASGGLAVRFTAANGEVWIPSVAVPSTDEYRVTVVYAPGGAWSGYLRGNDDGVPATYTPGTGCCVTATVSVELAPGGSLHIGLSTGSGAFPAIDRVVIEPPA